MEALNTLTPDCCLKTPAQIARGTKEVQAVSYVCLLIWLFNYKKRGGGGDPLITLQEQSSSFDNPISQMWSKGSCF